MFVAELRWDTVFFSTDCHFSSLVWEYIFSFVLSYFSFFTTLQTRLCMCGPNQIPCDYVAMDMEASKIQ